MYDKRLLLVPLVLAAHTLYAQEPSGALELKTVVEKVEQLTEQDGTVKTRLVPVATALPGDEVVYTVMFKNVGRERAENIQITNPIPAEMRYLDGSAFGPGTEIHYSADGGISYGRPEQVLVPDSEGEQRLAAAQDYTHIRWHVTTPLDAGAQGFARFRAVVR